jgi:NADPH-dependent 2,4-dienoyl-CoA reductase/sulfur reductase-like enzyme
VHSNEIPLADFLLIGGGLASATAAEILRAAGAEGRIAILSAEKILPYHRPPLSKSFLLNGPDKTNILIHDEAFYRDRDIEIHLGARVRWVDVGNRTVETDAGAHFSFHKLLIATGAGVNRLSTPGADLSGVHYLHTVSDALSLYKGRRSWGELYCDGARCRLLDARHRHDLDRERASALQQATLAGGLRVLRRIL